MRDYGRNSRSSGGRRRGGDFRRRDSGRREMHSAVCDECGNNCEVPFRPSGDKPIYCSDCFERKEGGGSRGPSRRGSGRPNYERGNNTNKKLLEQITSLNSKVDRILEVLESGTKKKPTPKKVVVKKVKKATKAKKVIKKVTSK